MKCLSVTLAAGVFLAAVVPPAHAQASTSDNGADGFDFLVGDWRVRHHRARPESDEWISFDGTCTLRKMLGESGNVEEHDIDAPAGRYRALGFRTWDPKVARWSIWWLDGRYPSGPVVRPVQGNFENGVGTFHADYEVDGKPMSVRFIWSDITPTSARWQQAQSADGRKTWKTNWFMEFTRITEAERVALQAKLSPESAAAPAGMHDFDFLTGDWRVRHRYLRASGEWAEIDGTSSNRLLLKGMGNLEEHLMNVPSGAYRAMALRSFDAKAGEWVIWWLDGRDPSAPLAPPMRGRFTGGTGTFLGETPVDGKPTPTRFIWSGITPDTARWEQSYSYDGGKTWQHVWSMDFARASRP